MSYNGSGTFNINTAGQPVVTGTVISSTAFNALTADLGTGLSTAITKDGQTVATALIPFAAGMSSTTGAFSSTLSAGNTTVTGTLGVTGKVGIGSAAQSTIQLYVSAAGTDLLFDFGGTGGDVMYSGAANAGITAGENAGASILFLRKNTATSRSINAAGTINASGADYAEYMTKCGDFNIAKGAICGVTLKGELTNVFADAISFMVKSTNPSYVGGDAWGDENAVGERPKRLDDETDDQFFARKAPFEKALETARQKVDRVAFAGQVPVNVLGATAGQYIIPVNDNGAIGGQAISNPTFEQYQSAVGKVIAIESDGRARIIVKVA